MCEELQEKLEEIQENASLSALQKHAMVHEVLKLENEKEELTNFEKFLLVNKSCILLLLVVLIFACSVIN